MQSSKHRTADLAAAIDAAITRQWGGLARASLVALSAVLVASGFWYAPDTQAGNAYLVNTSGDPGPPGTLSLRQAITSANAADGNTVSFAPSLVGSTITLASGEIPIVKATTITGPGAGALVISGNNVSRVFNISPGFKPVTISGLTITHGFSPGNGGAIVSQQATLTISNAVIRDSKATRGGGIYFATGNVSIEDSRLTGNLATAVGGAIYAADHFYMRRDTVDGNTAGELCGGICVFSAAVAYISSSTISGNVVPQPSEYNNHSHGAGGLGMEGVALGTVYNSTIANNYAYTNGGGVFLLDAGTANHMRIYTSTIAGNGAQLYETGIGITAPAGNALIFGSIIANNTTAGANADDDLAGSFTVTSSLVKNPGAATLSGTGSLFGQDPQLGPLADHGGPTWTLLPAVTSPAINALPCSCFPVDQRGAQRAIAHPNADMGAVERQYPEDLIFRSGFNPP